MGREALEETQKELKLYHQSQMELEKAKENIKIIEAKNKELHDKLLANESNLKKLTYVEDKQQHLKIQLLKVEVDIQEKQNRKLVKEKKKLLIDNEQLKEDKVALLKR